MSNKKKRADKTDWKQVAQSMHDKPVNLYEKLVAIIDLALQMVAFVDKKHPGPIKKIIDRHKSLFRAPVIDRDGLNCQENEPNGDGINLSAHYVKLHCLDMNYDDSLIAESYFGILGLLARIENGTNFVARYSHERGKSRVNAMEFIKKILCTDAQVPLSFLNEVVPLFFSLQVHSCNLVMIANRPPGAIADPRAASSRAATGGKAKNYGEHILRGMIFDFLNDQNPKRNYKDVKALCLALRDALVNTLSDYLSRVGETEKESGEKIRYGEDIKDPYDFDLQRKINQWKNKHPEFKQSLERICLVC